MRLTLCFAGLMLVSAACGDDDSTDTSGSGGSATAGSSSGGNGTGASATGGTATGGTGGSPAGTGGLQDCSPACAGGLVCCNGVCVNEGNDIKNCGSCGTVCEGASPFCDNGTCGDPPCDSTTVCAGTTTCCGSECCDLGMLCCVVPAGPVGPPECVAPNDRGTCEPGCPECRCAAPDTAIATPNGDRPIAELSVGDLVYSIDRGQLVVVPIAKVHWQAVVQHRVMKVTLENGAVLEISPRHPTADSRLFADLRAGDSLHGMAVMDAVEVPYTRGRTHDILPASDSGAYFAGGALVGSTLAQGAAPVQGVCFSPPRRPD